MDQRRLNSWLEGASALPEFGRIGVFNAWAGIDLPEIASDRIRAVQPIAPEYASLVERGLTTAKIPNCSYEAVIIRVPRAKDLALSYLRDAVSRTPDGAPIILDGQKTDGIESLLKVCRKRFEVREVVSKAHGKLFWFAKRGEEQDVIQVLDLPEPAPKLQPFGFHTAPGVFSAGGPDPGSEFLASVMPPLEGRVADLGAGWGYLSHKILEAGAPDVLHLVEADWLALACAKKNVLSEVARFHWEDANAWRPDDPLDVVVTNPPFHAGRAADPGLGRAFIRSAAAMLRPKGCLWLVANRQLPYESTLAETFRDVREVAQSTAFKVFCAERPAKPVNGRK